MAGPWLAYSTAGEQFCRSRSSSRLYPPRCFLQVNCCHVQARPITINYHGSWAWPASHKLVSLPRSLDCTLSLASTAACRCRTILQALGQSLTSQHVQCLACSNAGQQGPLPCQHPFPGGCRHCRCCAIVPSEIFSIMAADEIESRLTLSQLCYRWSCVTWQGCGSEPSGVGRRGWHGRRPLDSALPMPGLFWLTASCASPLMPGATVNSCRTLAEVQLETGFQ